MGECYWHSYEVYPGHSCPDCEDDQRRTSIDNYRHGYAKNMVPEHKYCPECEVYPLKSKKHGCI